jgi:2'-5' RNA ligase
MSHMPETAFAVLVPEAEEHVAHLRARHDPSAALGAQAHVTILYPFMALQMIDTQVLAPVRAALSGVATFDMRFGNIRRFPGVLYLAPQDDAPLVALTRLIAGLFPAFPPYAGRHSGIVPHLTVAQAEEGQLDLVERELRSTFPASGFASRCDQLALMENASGRWRQMQAFPLGTRA